MYTVGDIFSNEFSCFNITRLWSASTASHCKKIHWEIPAVGHYQMRNSTGLSQIPYEDSLMTDVEELQFILRSLGFRSGSLLARENLYYLHIWEIFSWWICNPQSCNLISSLSYLLAFNIFRFYITCDQLIREGQAEFCADCAWVN